MDTRLCAMLSNGNAGAARVAMTEFCRDRCDRLMTDWRQLENYLLVKFVDGNVKRQNADGSFRDNGSGKEIPYRPLHPKFRERWLRAIVQDHGDVVREKPVK